MRLDKFLCDGLAITRKQAGKIIRSGDVSVDGYVVKQAAFKVDDDNEVCWQDQSVQLAGNQYFMMNKADGFVCANTDPTHPTVFQWMDEIGQEKLHIAGRLDIDTTGLLLITNDGQWSHRVTSPRKKCGKIYRVFLARPLTSDMVKKLETGILLHGEKHATKPAKVKVIYNARDDVSPLNDDERISECLLTIYEGKYHQVKRMFISVGNEVLGLHREAIGDIQLDSTLKAGEYRPLSPEEIASV